MFIVSRFEQFVEYFWTGAQWTGDKAKAKRFPNRRAAQEEMRRMRIQWTVNINAV